MVNTYYCFGVNDGVEDRLLWFSTYELMKLFYDHVLDSPNCSLSANSIVDLEYYVEEINGTVETFDANALTQLLEIVKDMLESSDADEVEEGKQIIGELLDAGLIVQDEQHTI